MKWEINQCLENWDKLSWRLLEINWVFFEMNHDTFYCQLCIIQILDGFVSEFLHCLICWNNSKIPHGVCQKASNESPHSTFRALEILGISHTGCYQHDISVVWLKKFGNDERFKVSTTMKLEYSITNSSMKENMQPWVLQIY